MGKIWVKASQETVKKITTLQIKNFFVQSREIYLRNLFVNIFLGACEEIVRNIWETVGKSINYFRSM